MPPSVMAFESTIRLRFAVLEYDVAVNSKAGYCYVTCLDSKCIRVLIAAFNDCCV